MYCIEVAEFFLERNNASKECAVSVDSRATVNQVTDRAARSRLAQLENDGNYGYIGRKKTKHYKENYIEKKKMYIFYFLHKSQWYHCDVLSAQLFSSLRAVIRRDQNFRTSVAETHINIVLLKTVILLGDVEVHEEFHSYCLGLKSLWF